MNCVQCKRNPVEEEFTRCPDCNISHQELVKKLNANHKVWEKPVKEELIGFKSIKNGIEMTTFMTRAEAAIWNLKIPPEYDNPNGKRYKMIKE